jgi:hypothetical protein
VLRMTDVDVKGTVCPGKSLSSKEKPRISNQDSKRVSILFMNDLKVLGYGTLIKLLTFGHCIPSCKSKR